MFDNFTATGIVVSLVSSFLLITMLRRMFPSQFYNIKATDGKDTLLLSDQAAYINNRDQELGNSLVTVLVDCVEMPTVSGVSSMVHAGAKVDWHYKLPVWNYKRSVESEPA